MHSTIYHENTPIASLNEAKLTRFDRWWYSLMPPVLKKFLPPWPISIGLLTIGTLCTKDPVLSPLMGTAIALLWASISFIWLFVKLKRWIEPHPGIILLYHGGLSLLIANPVFAQTTDICTTTGLFSVLTSFISTLFSAITFGGLGGGTLSNMLCQVVGFLTITILLTILSSLAYVAFQVGRNGQPLSMALEPLMGFLIFAGGATLAIGVMIGTSTPTTTT
jgi:hypothetical protein